VYLNDAAPTAADSLTVGFFRSTVAPLACPAHASAPTNTHELAQRARRPVPVLVASVGMHLGPVWAGATPRMDSATSTHPHTRASPCKPTVPPPPSQVLYTPGHTIDSVSFYFPAENRLFTGDTLCACPAVFVARVSMRQGVHVRR
jgi:glyoxylase-like metal-dependent hydrolase (beta-lactamase superfamily II)